MPAGDPAARTGRSSSLVRVDRSGPVTTVIIDRPEVRNAVDGPTAAKLADAFRAFDADPEADRALEAVLRATSDNRSSMLQDVERGRPTEIDAISGELLRIAAAHGVDLPATREAVGWLARQGAPAAGQPS